jgi:transposase-like protein
MKCPNCQSEDVKINKYKKDGATCECLSCSEKFEAGV